MRILVIQDKWRNIIAILEIPQWSDKRATYDAWWDREGKHLISDGSIYQAYEMTPRRVQ